MQGRRAESGCGELPAKGRVASRLLPADIISTFTQAVGITPGFRAADDPALTPGPGNLIRHLAKQLIPVPPYDVISGNYHRHVLSSSRPDSVPVVNLSENKEEDSVELGHTEKLSRLCSRWREGPQ